VRVVNDETGARVQGTMQPDGTILEDGTGQSFGVENGALVPFTGGTPPPPTGTLAEPGYPSPAFQPPGAQAGTSLGSMLATPPPAPLAPPTPAPGVGGVGPTPLVPAEPGTIAFASPAWGPEKEPPQPPAARQPPPAAAPQRVPETRPQSSGATPSDQMRYNFHIAKQGDPAINNFLAQHPELDTVDKQVWATAGAVNNFMQKQKIYLAEQQAKARVAQPMQRILSAVDFMLSQYEQARQPLPQTKKLMTDVLPQDQLSTWLGDVLGGPEGKVGQFVSPAGPGIINPFNAKGPGLYETVEFIRRRGPAPDNPLYEAADFLNTFANGLATQITRATGEVGPLTEPEQHRALQAYIPTPGVDTAQSATGKMRESERTLRDVKAKILARQIEEPMVALGALFGVTPDSFVRQERSLQNYPPAEPRSLEAPQ
jgi:hypothetical protein